MPKLFSAISAFTVAAFVYADVTAAPVLAAPALPPPSAAAAQGHPAEVSIPNTRRLTFVSKVNGHAYSIDIALPDIPPPPAGYPVIYVLDGDRYFASVAEAVRVNAPQAVIVGIGYPDDPAWITKELANSRPPPNGEPPTFDDAVTHARAYDLTLPGDPTLYHTFSPAQAIKPGGVDDFLETIETEIKPRIYALALVNRSDQTLFGHSFGGLAVVDALFTEPEAFRTFVAASPALWWGNEIVLQKEAAFDAVVNAGKVTPRVLITVGGREETPPKLPPALAAMQAELDADAKAGRMIGNACDLATRLKALHGAKGYEVADCAVFPDQDHGISPWPAIGRAVSFAFPR